MTYGELKRRLRRLGMRVDHQGRRHELWLNPAGGRRAPIPRHSRQEVPDGTLQDILRELGVTRAEFDRR